MEIRQVKAAQGWRWIKQGYGLFRKYPLMWINLILLYYFLMGISNVLPVVGGALMTLLLPVFSVGFLMGAKAVENGDELEIKHLFAGFKKDHLSPYITLGGIYLVSTILIFGVASLIDGGTLMRMALFGEHPANDITSDPKFLAALELALILFVPLLMAYWFAPALIAFKNAKPLESLLTSLRACLRNFLPFTIYSLILFALGSIVPGVIAGLLSMLLRVNPIATTWIVFIPVLIVLLPTTFASFYTSYRDIFEDLPVSNIAVEGEIIP